MDVGSLERAAAVLRAARDDRVRRNLSMAPLTTFRIGGPASIYFEPDDEEDLLVVAEALRSGEVPVAILGKGSNVLVSDEGFPGLVLRLGRGFRWAARSGERIAAGGSMPVPALAGVALHHALAGLEFGVAIPATVGGAVAMNAGAHGHEIGDLVGEIDVFRLREGRSERIAPADAGFAYRRSALPADALVTGATLDLGRGEPGTIRTAMDEARAWRRATQPLAEPNCGSVFANPPDAAAARLIDEAGGKGMRVGGAAVSTKHANFIVADVGARAADVAALIRRVQELVERRTGIRLQPEVRMIGRFVDAA
jgi:UDP-N-acetylmuramate dehydrogenase